MKEKISVIIPVYNVEPYLERCLKSVTENTYRNLEIICVNDGSTDNCGAILEKFAAVDDRITVITQKNGGLSAARNSGLNAATGDFVVFTDSDDWLHPQFFEILTYFQKKSDYDLVICGFDRVSGFVESGEYDVSRIQAVPLDLEGIYNHRDAKIFATNKLYKKELIGTHRFVEPVRLAEDAAFNGLVLGSYENVRALKIDAPLYYYFDRPGSLAHGLGGKETLALAEVFDGYIRNATSLRAKRIYLEEAMKRALSGTYVLSLQPTEKEKVRNARKMIRRELKEFCALPGVPVKKRIQYSVFGYFPLSYRVFRIMDDPTLLKMEKDLRKRKRERR